MLENHFQESSRPSTDLHSLQSCMLILSWSTDSLFSFNPFHVLPFNLSVLTSKPTIVFINRSSSIFSMCPNHLNTLFLFYLTLSIRVTPHIIFKHLISFISNILFLTAILNGLDLYSLPQQSPFISISCLSIPTKISSHLSIFFVCRLFFYTIIAFSVSITVHNFFCRMTCPPNIHLFFFLIMLKRSSILVCLLFHDVLFLSPKNICFYSRLGTLMFIVSGPSQDSRFLIHMLELVKCVDYIFFSTLFIGNYFS